MAIFEETITENIIILFLIDGISVAVEDDFIQN